MLTMQERDIGRIPFMDKIDVAYINPFIVSVDTMFSQMLDCKTKRGELGVSVASHIARDITAVITLSGPVKGAIALQFPVKTALAIIERLLDIDTKIVDETVLDGIAEVVNIVAGGAKSSLQKNGSEVINLGIPSVMKSSDIAHGQWAHSAWVEIPFDSDLGNFSLKVTFEGTTVG